MSISPLGEVSYYSFLSMLGNIASNNLSSFKIDFILKSNEFLQASFIFLSTPFPAQFIKNRPTVSISPK